MRRTVAVWLLVVSLLSHGLAMAGNGLVYYSEHGIGHALLHWQDTGHHHHHDGSVHADPSDESAHHVQSDGALGAAALLAAPCGVVAQRPTQLSRAAVDPPLSSPFLEGPTRPPRLTA